MSESTCHGSQHTKEGSPGIGCLTDSTGGPSDVCLDFDAYKERLEEIDTVSLLLTGSLTCWMRQLTRDCSPGRFPAGCMPARSFWKEFSPITINDGKCSLILERLYTPNSPMMGRQRISFVHPRAAARLYHSALGVQTTLNASFHCISCLSIRKSCSRPKAPKQTYWTQLNAPLKRSLSRQR